MKKMFILVLFSLVTTVTFAQIALSAGVDAGFSIDNANITQSTTTTIDMLFKTLNFGAFVDATYAVLSVDYALTIGDPSTTYAVSGTKNQLMTDLYNALLAGTSQSQIEIALLGKYPFKLTDAITLFPAVGIRYVLNLTDMQNGTDMKATYTDERKADMNDLYIVAGAGCDISLGALYIRPLLLANYDLTATPKNPAPNTTFSQYGLRVCIAAGYKF